MRTISNFRTFAADGPTKALKPATHDKNPAPMGTRQHRAGEARLDEDRHQNQSCNDAPPSLQIGVRHNRSRWSVQVDGRLLPLPQFSSRRFESSGGFEEFDDVAGGVLQQD